MPDIFISYAREDAATARRFAEAFQAQGLDVWWDVSLRSGEAFDEVIETALKAAKAVVVLWSPRSVVSRWVRAEATLADRNKTLVPVLIESCERPIIFELTHTADLIHWRGDVQDTVWQAFASDVRKFVDIRTEPVLPDALRALPPVSHKDQRPFILVIPFVNMSGDREQEYFSDGVSEDIITDLGKVTALTVASRNTAFSFKGRTIAAVDLARQLGVSHILEGSVRKSGSRVRITAQLLEAGSDTQTWGERFDRTLEDIFVIQDEISQAIVAALKLKLAPEEKRALQQRDTQNVEAYELFHLARNFSRTGSERIQPLILRICKKVVELDPNFARAWALLSRTQSELIQRSAPESDGEDGMTAANTCIALDPGLAEGYAALAEVYVRGDRFNLDAGQDNADKALSLDPNCYEAHLTSGYCHVGKRRFAEAIRAFENAIRLVPEAFRPIGMVVQAYYGLGDISNAEAAARRSLAVCEKILAIEPDHGGALGFLASELARLGDTDRARTWARRAILFDPDNLRLHFNLACAMSNMGDADTAIDLLEGLVPKVSTGYLRWFEADNDLDPIRDHPRYAVLQAAVQKRLAEAAT